MDEESFKDEAETGDLIICSSVKMLNTEYKVAMIIKMQTDNFSDTELFVLRVGTTNESPIILQSWQAFRLFKFKNYNDCWFRHLHC